MIDKGTNRTTTGTASDYTWCGLGTSASIDRLRAAYLAEALADLEEVTNKRKVIWYEYYTGLTALDCLNIKLPIQPKAGESNFHFFYFLTQNCPANKLIKFLQENGVEATAHYRALHRTPFGKKLYRKQESNLKNAEFAEKHIVRLPTHSYLKHEHVERAIALIERFFHFH